MLLGLRVCTISLIGLLYTRGFYRKHALYAFQSLAFKSSIRIILKLLVIFFTVVYLVKLLLPLLKLILVKKCNVSHSGLRLGPITILLFVSIVAGAQFRNFIYDIDTLVHRKVVFLYIMAYISILGVIFIAILGGYRVLISTQVYSKNCLQYQNFSLSRL